MPNPGRATRVDPKPPSPAASANTAVSLVGTIFGLAVSVVGADFLTPFLGWLPKLLLGLFATSFLLSLAITRFKKAQTHWLAYASACGVMFSVAVLLLASLKTPHGEKSIGGLPTVVPAIRNAQAKFPLPKPARDTIAALDNPQEVHEGSAAQTPKQPPASTPEDSGQVFLAQLNSSLSSSDAQTRETGAENALAQSQQSPAKFRSVLRVLYRTKDPVLQEIAILHELKALEGKQIPITMVGASEPASGGVAAPSETAQQLSILLVGTSVTVGRVDLNSSSFAGFYNSDNRYPLNGSITSQGVQFTARIGYPYRENFPLQVTLHPSTDLQLIGDASVTLKTGPVSAPVALNLPF